MTQAPDRAAWRRRIAARWDTADRAALAEGARAACARLLALEAVAAGRVFGCFVSDGREPDTQPLLAAWHAAGRRVGVPAYDVARRQYGLAAIDADTVWRRGAFGIREPAEPRWMPPGELAVVVVPGVAFDRRGVRLGRGAGYYDRLLAGTTAVRIGLAYDFQVVDRLPREPHDIAMHFVVTEKQVIAPEAGALLEVTA